MHPRASEDLHAYNFWRRNLEPLPEGTVIRFDEMWRGVVMRDDIKAGTYFRLDGVREPLFYRSKMYPADMVYKMRQVSKTGKEFKRTGDFNVEGIASMIMDGKVTVIK